MKRIIDLKDKKFGNLIALAPTDKRDYKGSIIWTCKCNCGCQVEVVSNDLLRGQTKSCGCLRKNKMKTIQKTILKDQTSPTVLNSICAGTYPVHSNTGFIGVHRDNKGRFEASITFKKKRIRLGRFATLEEAIKARKTAEKELFKTYLEELKGIGYILPKVCITDNSTVKK